MGNLVIIGRCKDGVNVNGYVLQDLNTGEKRVIPADQTKMLAMNRQIKNCTAQEYNGNITIKGVGCKLKDLPNYRYDGTIINKPKNKASDKKYLIINRIVDGKSTVGYKIAYNNGVNTVSKVINRDKAIDLARSGKIANARVQMSNNNVLLRGVKCNILELPVIRCNAD